MKKGEKVLLVLGALLIAAGVLTGVTLGWDYMPGDSAHNDIDFPASGAESAGCSFISVQLDRLDVNIYSSTEKTVELSSWGSQTPERVDVTLDGGVLRITEKKLGFFRRLAASDDDAIVVRVPENWIGTVDVSTKSGDVYAGNLSSSQLTLRAASDSGTVSVSELKVAETQLSTVSGSVFLDAYRGGAVTAETTSGYMTVSDLKTENVTLSSVSGDLSVRNADLTGTLTLHSTSGEINLDDVTAAAIAADTTSGDLELDEVDTQSLTFSSMSGDISGELLHIAEFAADVSTVSGDISGVRNGSEGTRTLKVETVSGDIELDD